jgi:tetratricopeptide (TPR) repeat protein
VTSILVAICLLKPDLHPRPPLLKGIGNYSRPIHTTNPLAQTYFDQGLALFYAFHKQTSTAYFKEAERLDPHCAMAFWGEALSYAPDINFPTVDAPTSELAVKALTRAKSLAEPGHEEDLIDASQGRYAVPAPTERSALDQAYSTRMAALWAKYPNDPDVASLYAESLLILTPWHQWNPDGSPLPATQTTINVLREAKRLSPKHLMANHLWIHTLEGGPNAAAALDSADLLCKLTPALGHLVHMPSHIYVRTGQWDKAIRQNRLAIISDRAFLAKRGPLASYLPYLGHNRMMLAYAGMMNGSYRSTQYAFADWNEVIPPSILKEMAPLVDWMHGMPVDVEKRFGHWSKVLAFPEPPNYLPISRCTRLADRSVAIAALHRPAEADLEFTKFLAQKGKIPRDTTYGNNTAGDVLDVYEHLARGEILIQKGRLNAGIAELKRAVLTEDQLRYDEPPDWLQPCRHTLGAALLKAKRYKEAEAVYQEDLKRIPANGWSLLGMAKATKAEGLRSKSSAWMAKYLKVWSKDGEKQNSSCPCIPSP